MCVYFLCENPGALVMQKDDMNMSKQSTNTKNGIEKYLDGNKVIDIPEANDGIEKDSASNADDLDGDEVIDPEASYDKNNANTIMNGQSSYLFTKSIFVWLKMVYVMNPVFELEKRSATQIKDFSNFFIPICSRIKKAMGDKISFDTTPETEKEPFLLIDVHFPSCQLAVSKQLRLLLEVLSDLIDTPIQQGNDSDDEVLTLQRQLTVNENVKVAVNIVASVPVRCAHRKLQNIFYMMGFNLDCTFCNFCRGFLKRSFTVLKMNVKMF